jgi:hypothetical protein
MIFPVEFSMGIEIVSLNYSVNFSTLKFLLSQYGEFLNLDDEPVFVAVKIYTCFLGVLRLSAQTTNYSEYDFSLFSSIPPDAI